MGHFKWPNIHTIRVSKREEFRKIFKEITAPNLLNLMITVNLKIQELQQIQSPKNMMKTSSRHIIIKLLKASDKEKIFQATRRKRTAARRTQLRMAADSDHGQCTQEAICSALTGKLPT